MDSKATNAGRTRLVPGNRRGVPGTNRSRGDDAPNKWQISSKQFLKEAFDCKNSKSIALNLSSGDLFFCRFIFCSSSSHRYSDLCLSSLMFVCIHAYLMLNLHGNYLYCIYIHLPK